MWNLYQRVRMLEKAAHAREMETRQIAKEISALASDFKDADVSLIRTYYGDSRLWRAAVSPDVSVRSVVLALIDKLGYKISWNRGQQARVTLDKPKKA